MQTTVHIVLYLPTHGKDASFISELANLRLCLEELDDIYPDCPIFIRGDSNVNKKNVSRVTLLDQLLRDFSLTRVHLGHPTYHHFIGNGKFDSDIDVIIHTDADTIKEDVIDIICKNENPSILSHHDMILSRVELPVAEVVKESNHATAPRIPNTREKIKWSEEGITNYSKIVSPQLAAIRQTWLNSTSTASMSVLLRLTNLVMTKTASTTNIATSMANKGKKLSAPTPHAIRRAKQDLHKAHRAFRKHAKNLITKQNFKSAQKGYKQAVRTNRVREGYKRDQQLYKILSENPFSLYRSIKSWRRSNSTAIQKLTVGDKVFIGDAVSDGFYESMTSLKTCDIKNLRSDPSLSRHFSNYDHILQLCQDQHKIPAMSRQKAGQLLGRIKKNVSDYYSITAQHYINAGEEGLSHYLDLLNAIIDNVNNATLEELNIAHGLILYKGHNKDKNSDRAYRTISSCPFLAKSLDLYLSDLYHDLWDSCQAATQYQGSGSCHELASLLITELIQHSLHVLDRPVFLLSLDAQSAFDRCLRQILVCELYKAGLPGSAVTFINNRLANRATVYDWNGNLMGPGHDITGFEQGGINSSDFYKLYNNEQLKNAQASGLGVNLGSTVVSAIGQADDVVLAANDVDSLALLAQLTEKYCAKYRVTLVPSKTKLLAFHTAKQVELVHHAEVVSQVKIGGEVIKFVTETEHVGVLRNTSGNLPNITNRITAHKKALRAVLPAGMARNHRGNPAASLRVHQQYRTAVLFSGLVLTPSEIKHPG